MKWTTKPWKRLFNEKHKFVGWISSPKKVNCACGKPGEYLCEAEIGGEEVCQEVLCRDCVVNEKFCKKHSEENEILSLDVFGD